jgi:hypothetical protein
VSGAVSTVWTPLGRSVAALSAWGVRMAVRPDAQRFASALAERRAAVPEPACPHASQHRPARWPVSAAVSAARWPGVHRGRCVCPAVDPTRLTAEGQRPSGPGPPITGRRRSPVPRGGADAVARWWTARSDTPWPYGRDDGQERA